MKQSPPRPSQPRPVAFPEIPHSVLDNGLNVLVVENHTIPKVFVRLAFASGRVDNPPRNGALLSVALDLLEQGTQSRSSEEIARLLDQWAMPYEADVRIEHSTLAMAALRGFLETGLELLSDLVRHPAFAEEELTRLKSLWKSHLIAQRSQTRFLANERLYRSVYPDHPYGRTVVTIPHLEATRPQEIQEIYRRHFHPAGAFLLLAGAIEPEQGVALAERFFGDWEGLPVAPKAREELPEWPGGRVCLVHRPGSLQTRLLLAGRALPKGHADSIRLRVASQVLGGGGSSRLFLNLREKRGYTYGVGSRCREFRQDGLIAVSGDVRSDAVVDSVRQIFIELERMCDGLPDPKELARAQAEMTGSFVQHLETAASVGALELNRCLYDLPEGYYRDYVSTVRSVQAGEVQETFRRWIRPREMMVTAVGDAETLKPLLEEFGPVEVFDTDGKPVKTEEKS